MKLFLAVVALAVAGFVVLSGLGDGRPAATADTPLLRQPIVAEVEVTPIADTIVARADYTAGATIGVPPPQLEGARPVVVELFVEERGPIEEGAIIASVGGRPMFAFDGPIPMYRTIVPDDTGADVKLIQQALVQTGYLPKDTVADGVFGASTRGAIDKLYRSFGFDPLQGFSGDGRRRGSTIPLGEIAFIPGLPAIVATVTTSEGKTAAESVIAVAAAAAELSISATPDVAAVLEVGQPVELSDDRTGFAASSVVTGMGAGADGAVRVALEVPASLGADEVGRNFKAVVHLDDTAPVLNVPLGAVLTDSAGSTYVYVLSSETEYYRQPVGVERRDLGRAVVTEGDLEPGQLVIVGWYEP